MDAPAVKRRRFNWVTSDYIRKGLKFYYEWSARLKGQRFYCSALAGQSDYNITVSNLGVDHRIAFDAQSELVLTLRKPILEIEPISLLDGFRKIAGRDLADKRHPALFPIGIGDLNRPRHIRLARYETLLFQRFEMAHDPIW